MTCTADQVKSLFELDSVGLVCDFSSPSPPLAGQLENKAWQARLIWLSVITWRIRNFHCPRVPISYRISCSWTMGEGRLKRLSFFKKRKRKTQFLKKKKWVGVFLGLIFPRSCTDRNVDGTRICRYQIHLKVLLGMWSTDGNWQKEAVSEGKLLGSRSFISYT